jgi:regulator of nonsense transcripts 3
MATPTQPAGSRGHTNGVLAITASQTSGNGPRTVVTKPPSPKLKVVVRRLAPGLTEAEFTSILGDDWNVGQGKVDWFLYKPGKDSKEYVSLGYTPLVLTLLKPFQAIQTLPSLSPLNK